MRSNRPKGDWNYAYDVLDQLTGATKLDDGTLTQSFAYDVAGNMTQNSAVGAYSYPAFSSPRPHAPLSAGPWAFTYDANGNMLTGKGRTIAYDGENRPATVTLGGVTVNYVYGPDGKRLKKIVNGEVTLYIGADEEILDDGAAGKIFIKHLNDTVRRTTTSTGSKTNWLHRDHLSSVRLMTDATGAQVSENRYRPYGERTDVQLSASTVRESKGWIGERDDPETGLTYLNARFGACPPA